MARPPVGAMILALMALVAGVIDIIQGLRFTGALVFGPAGIGSGLLFVGFLALVVGLIWLGVAYSFWTTKPWAWAIGMVLSILGLIYAVIVLFSTGDVAYGLGVALLPVVVMWYLQQAGIKKTFGVEHE